MRAFLIAAALIAVVAGCPAPQQSPPTGPTGPTEPVPSSLAADGATCSTAADCQSGICEGEGCGTPDGVCAPKMRGCTKDLRPYCGCSGESFSTSSTCPGRRFAHRGECP
jgi:hypothetical protein